MKKTLLTVLVFFAALLTGTGVSAQTPIKIGFLGELSGPQGALGQDQCLKVKITLTKSAFCTFYTVSIHKPLPSRANP